jgi:lysophospholipase L1-like esterase
MIPLVLAVIVGVVTLFVVGKVAIAARHAALIRAYWQRRMNEPVRPEDFRLVALGDSSVQGVGADSPMDGYVGRIARYISIKTGRHVHITNVSTGGSTADVVRHQLPDLDLGSADLVIVADSNDMQHRVPVDRYTAELGRLVEALPAERTVFSDLPPWPGREVYQAALERATDSRGIRRADFAAILGRERRLDIFSWLPPHLNNKGYAYWTEAFRPQVDAVLAHEAADSSRRQARS